MATNEECSRHIEYYQQTDCYLNPSGCDLIQNKPFIARSPTAYFHLSKMSMCHSRIHNRVPFHSHHSLTHKLAANLRKIRPAKTISSVGSRPDSGVVLTVMHGRRKLTKRQWRFSMWTHALKPPQTTTVGDDFSFGFHISLAKILGRKLSCNTSYYSDLIFQLIYQC